MSSRVYLTYKFLYDDDLGKQIIKRHRSYLNADGITEDTPTTSLFRDRVVQFEEKVTGTSKGLRNIRAVVGERRLIAKIPYAPGNPLLKGHIEEILSQPQVDCGDYQGETSVKGVSTVSI